MRDQAGDARACRIGGRSVNENTILSGTSTSGWASDPERGDHGQPLRPQRGVHHDAKERRAIALDMRQRGRMIERTFASIPATVRFVEAYTGGGEARATWIRLAIAREIGFDTELEGKIRIRYDFYGIAKFPRGRPGTHGEGRSAKLRVRLPIEMSAALDRIVERDCVSVSVILQKAIDAEHARVRITMVATMRAITGGTAFARGCAPVI